MIRPRLFVSAILLATAISGLGGCTFSDGQPWGELTEFTLAVSLPAEANRIDDGKLLTSNDYAIDVVALQVHYSNASLTVASETASTFDPANPPEGCGGCHNGHCHCGDELVDYEVLAGGDIADAPVAADLPLATAPALSLNESADVAVTPCTSCELPRGELDKLRVTITGVTVDLSVTDTRTGDGQRLTDPYVMTGFVPLGAVVAAPMAILFDRDEPPYVAITAEHRLSVGLFDGVDWASSPTLTDEELAEALATALTDKSELNITLRRTP